MTNPSTPRNLETSAARERALLVACHLPASRFDPRDPLGELRALAETAGALPVGELLQNRRAPEAGTYIGSGKLAELKSLRDELAATLVIFDNDLSPSQIRNIEEAVGCKIIDRSELILDIFANRATTTAARLQVELAQLEYTYPRLRAMWTHLGQITGGAPVGIGTRGPGEQQIEIDRRLVQRRKTILRDRLAEIHDRRSREVARRKAEHFTVCLVGYTNAGKSTLFNSLTEPSGGGGAYADDRLFATLATRTRAWPLGAGLTVMLSDTVGFVRDLPHHLVASFRATLEEAVHADLLLIVLDVSDPQAALQYQVVNETLDQIEHDWMTPAPDNTDSNGVISTTSPRKPARLLVLNKIDRLHDESELAVWHRLQPDAIAASAITGAGLPDLAAVVRAASTGVPLRVEADLDFSAGRALALFESLAASILDRRFDTTTVRVTAIIGSRHLDRLRSLGARIISTRPAPPES